MVETQGNRQCLSRRGHWSHRQQRGLAKARREVLDTDAVGQRALAGQPVQERNDLDVALRPRRASQVWGRIGSGRTREGRGTLSHTLSVSVCVCVSAVLCVWLLCAAVLCAAVLLCCVLLCCAVCRHLHGGDGPRRAAAGGGHGSLGA